MGPQLNCSTPLAFPPHRVPLLERGVQKTVWKAVRRTGREQEQSKMMGQLWPDFAYGLLMVGEVHTEALG